MAFIWSNESEARLRELWTVTGASDSQIANVLAMEFRSAGGITRSSVIGKRHRLKLGVQDQPACKATRPRSGSRVPKAPKPAPVKADPRHRPSHKLAEQRREEALRRGFNLDAPDIKCEPVDLMGLRADSCRWPMDDGAMYCGNRVTNYRGRNEASPYCSHHYGLAYVQPRIFVRRNTA